MATKHQRVKLSLKVFLKTGNRLAWPYDRELQRAGAIERERLPSETCLSQERETEESSVWSWCTRADVWVQKYKKESRRDLDVSIGDVFSSCQKSGSWSWAKEEQEEGNHEEIWAFGLIWTNILSIQSVLTLRKQQKGSIIALRVRNQSCQGNG